MPRHINSKENLSRINGGSLTESQSQDVGFVQSYTSDRRLPLLPWLLKDEERKERNLEKPRLHEDAMFALLLEILLMDNLPLRFYFMCHQHGARASVKNSGPQRAHLKYYAMAHPFPITLSTRWFHCFNIPGQTLRGYLTERTFRVVDILHVETEGGAVG